MFLKTLQTIQDKNTKYIEAEIPAAIINARARRVPNGVAHKE
jgi:hypothetical protein